MSCRLDFQSSQRFATFVPIFIYISMRFIIQNLPVTPISNYASRFIIYDGIFLRNPLHVNNESMKDSPRILTLYRDLKMDHIMLYVEGNVKNQFGHFLMLSLTQTWTFSRNTLNITLQR